MKSLTKLAVTALCVGGILFAVGYAKGGTVSYAWYNHHLIPWNWVQHWGIVQDDIDYDEASLRRQIRDQIQEAGSDIKYIYDHSSDHPPVSTPNDTLPSNTQTSDASPKTDAIRSIRLELGRGRYTIQSGSAFAVTGTGLEQIKTWTDDEAVWHVSYTGYRDTISDTADRNVIITIPEGKQFDEIELSIGAATLTTGALTAQEIDVELGAGTLETGTLTVQQLSAKVGAGKAVMGLAGDWTEYQYEIKSGIGTVTTNNHTLASGLGGEFSGGTGSRLLDLEVGIGSIALTTQTN